MNDRGRFNNIIITISVMLNVILTVMLIILLGQTGSAKNDNAAELEENTAADNSESVFVLHTDDFDSAENGVFTVEQQPDAPASPPETAAPTTETTTAATTTTTTTTETATTTTTAATSAAADEELPTLLPDDGTAEDEGDWLDIWGMN